ncbi:hypothetical protein [Paenibacillus hamazuiensis]|uniref:hypothetical protein n=1 Tax=Paenibacillus hamazuiensis TaxID=2936508 RepID=UPI00200F3F61|nr:hypothetical protein [Paenibacillus hamazuiensis]
MTLPLVPLNIPNGWIINKNIFTEVCPERFHNDDYEDRWEFNEDILQIVNTSQRRIIDLGWYPEFNLDGQYCLKVVEWTNNWEEQTEYWIQPIMKYYSRDIKEIKNKIEDLIMKITEGRL